MKRIVLLRHGESTWNKDNRFTGWTDVDLTEKGIADANQTGILLKEKGFHFDKAYTSFLKRAVKTLNCVLDKMDQDWIPVEKNWRLNEKHYGELQGLNKAETAEKVTENWEQLKMKEKDGNKMVLSGVPSALPSLIKAYRIQDKARNVGFDWEERSQVWTKVKEEIGEFEAEVENMDKEKAEAEFGDVMFSLINAARLYKINPDNALELTNQKFIRRFNYLEEHTIKQGKNLKDMTLEEMDAIWNEAKKEEK